jgi:hypothetical protein
MGPVQKLELSTVRSHRENAAGDTQYASYPSDSHPYHYYCFSNS